MESYIEVFGKLVVSIKNSLRVQFVPDGTTSHSDVFLEYGKTKEAHECIINSAKILAATVFDLTNLERIKEIKKEFENYKDRM